MGKGRRFNTSDPTADKAVGNTDDVDAEKLQRIERIKQEQYARNERIRRARELAQGPSGGDAA